jgi:hypothetical protein
VRTGFKWGTLKEGHHLKDPGIDKRTILKWILQKWVGGLDRIDLVQDRNRWRAVVNAVMKFRVP